MSKTEKDTLKKAFRGYHRLTNEMLDLLKSYGLEIVTHGKHYQVRREGISMCVTISKSPSDHRSGLNTYRYLLKLIEA